MSLLRRKKLHWKNNENEEYLINQFNFDVLEELKIVPYVKKSNSNLYVQFLNSMNNLKSFNCYLSFLDCHEELVLKSKWNILTVFNFGQVANISNWERMFQTQE